MRTPTEWTAGITENVETTDISGKEKRRIFSPASAFSAVNGFLEA
jgi:hypothetical protein